MFPSIILVPLQFLYHYTNEKNFNNILDEKILRVSLRGRHGRFGTGVYLTSFTPDKGREAIKINNRDGGSHLPQYAEKTEECYLKFKIEDLDDVKNVQPKGHQQDIWLNPSEINLRYISYYSGYTDNSEEEEYHPCASVVTRAGMTNY
jgi:hypothetical protein